MHHLDISFGNFTINYLFIIIGIHQIFSHQKKLFLISSGFFSKHLFTNLFLTVIYFSVETVPIRSYILLLCKIIIFNEGIKLNSPLIYYFFHIFIFPRYNNISINNSHFLLHTYFLFGINKVCTVHIRI